MLIGIRLYHHLEPTETPSEDNAAGYSWHINADIWLWLLIDGPNTTIEKKNGETSMAVVETLQAAECGN